MSIALHFATIVSMKKAIIIILFFFFPLQLFAAGLVDLASKLSGKILLQVESYGRAWYVYPKDNKRYYLKDGNTAYELMRDLSLGISNKDLAKIPIKAGDMKDEKLVQRLKGMILLQVEDHGEAWYLNPDDGLRYYLKDGAAAYNIMRNLSLGIKDDDLRHIPMNSSQLTFDAAFNSFAYTKYDNGNFSEGYNDEQILPLASLTKLMTALVFYETDPDWDKEVVITPEEINYPQMMVGEDATSEVDLQAGEKVRINDLWTAMLVASSNQSAVILADNSGYTRSDFVAKMNEKAKELGLEKTVFYDVAGLDANNVSTPKEFAKLSTAAFAVPDIANTTNILDYKMNCISSTGEKREVSVANRNYSLLKFNPDASKTGFLIEAQRNVALKKNSSIIVIMHALSMLQRNETIAKLLK